MGERRRRKLNREKLWGIIFADFEISTRGNPKLGGDESILKINRSRGVSRATSTLVPRRIYGHKLASSPATSVTRSLIGLTLTFSLQNSGTNSNLHWHRAYLGLGDFLLLPAALDVLQNCSLYD